MPSLLSRVSSLVVAGVAAVALLAPSVSAGVDADGQTSIIYMDYTTGFETKLPTMVNAKVESNYPTGQPGSFRFGVDWNNDATDMYTILVPTFSPPSPNCFTLTAENSPSFCTPQPTTPNPNQITFLATGVHQCNYTVTWTCAFSGIMTVTYNGVGNDSAYASDAITTYFNPTSVVGDPQFVGLRGQSYQVHGIDGAVYNIISEKETQVNSRFVFLTSGKCPTASGASQDNCWSHPGSYLGEMSFQQLVDGKLHQALVVSGPASRGFASVQVDGAAMKVGDVLSFGDSFSITFTSAYSVEVTTADFAFELSNSDSFLNQAVRALVPLAKLRAHGLLGQTHQATLYPSALKYIAGQVDDYAIQDGDIFGSDFVYNQFQL